ncbi:MAG: LysE family translocator [Rhizobiaceae bacterium]
MPPLELMIAFLITTSAFAFIPGPAMIYAAARTIAGGRQAGLMAALGIHLGGYLHVILSAAGLAVLFHAIPPLYLAVKFAGAVYLIWMGISLFRAGDQSAANVGELAAGNRAFFQSMAVEMLNPKTAVFFLAFLPQFTDPTAAFPVWLQFLILGFIVNLIFSFADLLAIFMAGLITNQLRGSRSLRVALQRLGGTLIVGLGINLIFQKS